MLPAGARLCIVTHSRGGLVGDLLCLATDPLGDGAGFDALVETYRRQPRPDEVEAEAKDPALARLRLDVAAQEQAKLRALGVRLRAKGLQVERYVRVAAPARGTALLSDNLDVFLSGLLTLVRQFGAWSVGAVAGVVDSLVGAGVGPSRTRLIVGRAQEVLTRLADDSYDLVFIDGEPADQPQFVAEGVRLLRSGGVIVVHRAALGGRAGDAAANDRDVTAVREATRAIAEDERLTPVLVPLGDGLLAAVRD